MQLLEYLRQHHPQVKRTTFKRMLLERRISVNGRVATRLKTEIGPEDVVLVTDQPAARQRRPPKPAPPPPRVSRRDPARMPLRIVHEDDDILVVLKPAGLLTSTTQRETRPTLAAMLTQYLIETSPGSRIGIIHRLDRDASGLLVFTKNAKAYHSLKKQLFNRTVDRVYTAVIEGVPTPKDGRIQNYLMELPTGIVVRTDDPSKGQFAVTDYELLGKVRLPRPKTVKKKPPAGTKARPRTQDAPDEPPTHLSLLRIKLRTGRKHQIRAHFAARRTPIHGDPLYGPNPHPTIRMLLAATGLSFDHPRSKNRVSFEVEPPKEMRALFPAVEFTAATPHPEDVQPDAHAAPAAAEDDDEQ
jgi:23S rRNA pseudouridine1911/1915/1917 synthase